MAKSTQSEDELLKTDDEMTDSIQNNSDQPSNLDLMQYLKDMKNDLCTKQDLSVLKQNVTTQIKSIDTKVNTTKTELNQLNQRLIELETNKQTSSFRLELDKQRTLKNNITIMGIPYIEGEDIKDLVSKIFTVINCSIKIESTTVYRTKGKNSMIVVKLDEYPSKLSILQAKTNKTIRLKNIISCDLSTGDGIVFINNHVTPYFGKLLQVGRLAMKNKQIHSCWLASMGCMLRVQENSQPMGYRSVIEFNEIIQSKTESISSSIGTSKRLIQLDSTEETSPSTQSQPKRKRGRSKKVPVGRPKASAALTKQTTQT